ncbi:MAG: regulatory protein RecX [Lachnospiraceae bacterium]|nr:regulatory protein RecX [Lachnospiraceae bacterium]
MDYQCPGQQEQLLRKAKLKALHLLERMDRTEAQLREKLLAVEFEQEIVEQAIVYVKSFGYLDDERYVRNYIEYRSHQKSRRQLEQELQFRKGVSSELIQKVYEELEPTDEKELIRRYLEKKHYCSEVCDEKQKQRLIASLARKGFRIGDILTVMKEEL